MLKDPSRPVLIGVVTMLYETDWQEDSRDLDARVRLVSEIVKEEPSLDLLVLPAGTFVIDPGHCLREIARDLESSWPLQRPLLAWGIDERTASGESDAPAKRGGKGFGVHAHAHDLRDPYLSFYACISLPEGDSPLWVERQLAYRSTQTVAASRLPRQRLFPWNGLEVGVLLCGELLARVGGRERRVSRFRHIVAGADLIIDLAHADVAVRGFVRWTTAMQDAVAHIGGNRALLMAQHLCVDSIERRLPKFTEGGQAPRLCAGDTLHIRRIQIGRLRATSHAAAIVDVYEPLSKAGSGSSCKE